MEKVVYFELYDKRLEFACMKSVIEPVSKVDYDDYPDKQYVKALILERDQAEKLKIVYTKIKSEGLSANDVKFTR